MSEDFNISIRKFLKQVGITSQKAIESAMKNSPTESGKSFEAKVVLSIEKLNLEHIVTGKIEG